MVIPIHSEKEQGSSGIQSIEELHPILLSMREAVVLDIETTGFSRTKHAEILEIGAVKLDIEQRTIAGSFSQLIRPSEAFTISSRITEVTNITWDMVKGQPYIEQVLPAFASFIGDSPVVAHNAAFDWERFLIPAFASVGLHKDNPVICTERLAKHLYPGRGRAGYNLNALCTMFGGRPIEGHHRAYVDSKWTASLLLRLLDAYRAEKLIEEGTASSVQHGKREGIDWSKMEIRRVSFYQGQSKRAGGKIYVYTNFGKICVRLVPLQCHMAKKGHRQYCR